MTGKSSPQEVGLVGSRGVLFSFLSFSVLYCVSDCVSLCQFHLCILTIIESGLMSFSNI